LKIPTLIPGQQVGPFAERLPAPLGPIGTRKAFVIDDLSLAIPLKSPSSPAREFVPSTVDLEIVDHIIEAEKQRVWKLEANLNVSRFHDEAERPPEGLRKRCKALALDVLSRDGELFKVVAYFGKGEKSPH